MLLELTKVAHYFYAGGIHGHQYLEKRNNVLDQRSELKAVLLTRQTKFKYKKNEIYAVL
jgi:hypothetical protein